MMFWLGILVAVVFLWFGVKRGFYEIWALWFNVLVSVYLSVFLTPMIVQATAAEEMSFSSMLVMLGIAIGTFVILHGISYILLIGQFKVTFPKIIDVAGGGFLGFLTGYLIWSFLLVAISVSPISQNSFAKAIGLSNSQGGISYVAWWGDLVNGVVGSEGSEQSTKQAIAGLVQIVKEIEETKVVRKSNVPRTVTTVKSGPGKTKMTREEQLGPPPEANLDDVI